MLRGCAGRQDLGNSWSTSTRYHQNQLLPCVFGCSEARDSLAHYVVCPRLKRLVSFTCEHLNLNDDFLRFWGAHASDVVPLKVVAGRPSIQVSSAGLAAIVVLRYVIVMPEQRSCLVCMLPPLWLGYTPNPLETTIRGRRTLNHHRPTSLRLRPLQRVTQLFPIRY